MMNRQGSSRHPRIVRITSVYADSPSAGTAPRTSRRRSCSLTTSTAIRWTSLTFIDTGRLLSLLRNHRYMNEIVRLDRSVPPENGQLFAFECDRRKKEPFELI